MLQLIWETINMKNFILIPMSPNIYILAKTLGCIQLYALHFVQVVLICLPLLLYITCFVLGVMFLRWLARASLVINNNKNYYYHHLLLSEKAWYCFALLLVYVNSNTYQCCRIAYFAVTRPYLWLFCFQGTGMTNIFSVKNLDCSKETGTLLLWDDCFFSPFQSFWLYFLSIWLRARRVMHLFLLDVLKCWPSISDGGLQGFLG